MTATDSRFTCFIRFDDFKFDIVIDDKLKTNERRFSDIYQKIQQIFQIAFNRCVTFTAYVFERVDPLADKSSIIRTFEDTIRHFTIINMREKVQTKNSMALAVDDPDVVTLRNRVRDVRAFNLIVGAIKHIASSQTWDFSIKPEVKWKVISRALIERNPSFAEYTPEVCHSIFNDLAFFYTRTFDKLNMRLGLQLQESFDSLKSVHRLNANQVFPPPVSTNLMKIADKPEMKDYFRYGFNVDEVIIQQKRCDIHPTKNWVTRSESSPVNRRQSKERIESDSVRRGSPNSFRIPRLDHDKEKLKNSQKEIKMFNAIVQSIDPDWDLGGPSNKMHRKWFSVYDSVIKADKSISRDLWPGKCETLFYDWIAFYIKTFYKFDNQLEPELQQTFNLLKIVHVLKPKRIFGGRYHHSSKELKKIAKDLGVDKRGAKKDESNRSKKSKKRHKDSDNEFDRTRRTRDSPQVVDMDIE